MHSSPGSWPLLWIQQGLICLLQSSSDKCDASQPGSSSHSELKCGGLLRLSVVACPHQVPVIRSYELYEGERRTHKRDELAHELLLPPAAHRHVHIAEPSMQQKPQSMGEALTILPFPPGILTIFHHIMVGAAQVSRLLASANLEVLLYSSPAGSLHRTPWEHTSP